MEFQWTSSTHLMFSIWAARYEKKNARRVHQSQLFLATILKPNNFKMTIYDFFELLVLFRVVS